MTVDSLRIFTMTTEARRVVVDALANEDQSASLALWVEVTGVSGSGYSYDLFFSDRVDAADDALIIEDEDVTIVIPAESVERLRGSRLEFSEEGGGGLVLVNPNNPTPEEANPGVPPEVLAKGLETTLALRAVEVLERFVNPSIASHGGRAELVAMDDEKFVAFVRLSGGCQGCAMSRLTLSQGIEATLREEIPELVGVVDVTDHASGANPFYAK